MEGALTMEASRRGGRQVCDQKFWLSLCRRALCRPERTPSIAMWLSARTGCGHCLRRLGLALTCYSSLLPLERFVQEHLEISLVAQALFLRQPARAGDIFRGDPDRYRWCHACPLACMLQHFGKRGGLACCSGLLHPSRRFFAVRIPPCRFIRFRLEFRNLAFFHHSPLRSIYSLCSRRG